MTPRSAALAAAVAMAPPKLGIAARITKVRQLVVPPGWHSAHPKENARCRSL